MSNLSSNEWVMDPKTVKRNRIKLLGIFAVALLPLFFAFAMYFGDWAIPQGKTNKGSLIWPPVTLNSIDTKEGQQTENALMTKVRETKTWTIMITGASACDANCLDSLHTIKQVNIALGKEAKRVSRLMVSVLGEAELQQVMSDYPEMLSHKVESSELHNFHAAAVAHGLESESLEAQPWMVWVVDPLGNVILQYTKNNDGYDMIDDLKRVLKLSNIG